MILVTGAGGKTGQAIIKTLSKNKAKIRSFIHNAHKAEYIKSLGATEVIVGDVLNAEEVDQAAKRIRAIYHICPNVHPNEVEIGAIILEAALKNGVEHFVFHSVLHPQIEAMPHHWQKMRVEEKVFTSGLAFTILQPTMYMQNILGYLDSIKRDGVYAVPYSTTAPLSMIDVNDVAEVAAKVLGEKMHYGATYELCGSETLTPEGIARSIGKALGNTVIAQTQTIDAWKAANHRLGNYQIKVLSKMFLYYDKYGLVGNSNTIENLLGRPPASFEEFLGRELTNKKRPA